MLDDWSCARYMHICQQQASSVRDRTRSPSTGLSPSQYPIDHPRQTTEQGKPLQATRGQLKRTRLREDIEGDGSAHWPRKKRRLRLTLITSRLSEPYATPTTHIAGRRAVRQGIWARQRVSGRNLLRKAAILNSISRTRKSGKVTNKDRRAVTTPTILPHAIPSSPPSVTKILPPVSPPPDSLLSPSDYDPFDYEEDCMEEEEEDDDDIEGTAPIYSDFNKLQEAGPEVDGCDENYSFDSFSSFGIGERQFAEPGEKAIGLIMENEVQNEVSCAPRTR